MSFTLNILVFLIIAAVCAFTVTTFTCLALITTQYVESKLVKRIAHHE